MNEKDDFSLQRTETQAQPRDVTKKERERNRGRENNEESNRETSNSMDTDREGENGYVWKHSTRNSVNSLGLEEEETNRHEQAKQLVMGRRTR